MGARVRPVASDHGHQVCRSLRPTLDLNEQGAPMRVATRPSSHAKVGMRSTWTCVGITGCSGRSMATVEGRSSGCWAWPRFHASSRRTPGRPVRVRPRSSYIRTTAGPKGVNGTAELTVVTTSSADRGLVRRARRPLHALPPRRLFLTMTLLVSRGPAERGQRRGRLLTSPVRHPQVPPQRPHRPATAEPSGADPARLRCVTPMRGDITRVAPLAGVLSQARLHA
jgi:hypothetical protein